MSYSTTCDASHKVKAGGSHRTHFVRHIARDADIAAGYDFGHANTTIDKARTHLNRSMVNDGAGGFRRPVATLTEDGWRPPSAEFDDCIQARLDTVTRPLRKDAVAVRPLVMKLDGLWWDEHCPEWETEGMNAEAERLHAVMLDWACDRFGQQNIAGYAYHLDEAGYPEIQVLMTPVTDDGRLSQKDFFPNGANMSKMHQDLRKHLKAHGYDAEMSVTRRSKDRLSSREYARRADKATSLEKRADREWERIRAADKAVLAARRDVTARELALTGREAALEAQKSDLEARKESLKDRRESLGRWKAALLGTSAVLEGRQAAARGLYDELRGVQGDLVAAREQLTPAGRSQVAGAIRSLNSLGARLEALTAHVVEVPQSPDDPTR